MEQTELKILLANLHLRLKAVKKNHLVYSRTQNKNNVLDEERFVLLKICDQHTNKYRCHTYNTIKNTENRHDSNEFWWMWINRFHYLVFFMMHLHSCSIQICLIHIKKSTDWAGSIKRWPADRVMCFLVWSALGFRMWARVRHLCKWTAAPGAVDKLAASGVVGTLGHLVRTNDRLHSAELEPSHKNTNTSEAESMWIHHIETQHQFSCCRRSSSWSTGSCSNEETLLKIIQTDFNVNSQFE